MDHRLKYKKYNYTTFRQKQEKKLGRFLQLNTKSTIHKRKNWQVWLNINSVKDPGKENEKTRYSLGENMCKPHIKKEKKKMTTV